MKTQEQLEYGPMRAQYFKVLHQAMQKQGTKGNLMLFSAQTGSGKSYAIANFMVDLIRQDSSCQIFYVTNQIKNFGIDHLSKFWQQSATDLHGSFVQNIAVMRGLADTCKLIIETMPVAFKSVEMHGLLDQLKKAIDFYFTLNRINVNSYLAHIKLRDAEYAIRQELIRQLSILAKVSVPVNAEGQQRLQHYVATHPSEEFEWLHDIYPTFDFDAKRIIVMTTKKFEMSFTAFFDKKGQPMIACTKLNNALVIIDEVDSTQAALQSTIIEEALGASVDLLSLFNTTLPALNMKSKLNPLMKQIIAQADEYQRLQIRARELRDRFKLDRLHKMAGGQQPTGFIIHTPRQTFVSSDTHWHTDLDRPNNMVRISTEEPDELQFEAMLHHLAEFISRFTHFIQKCAERYVAFKDVSEESSLTLEDACKTIYNVLGFQEKQANSLFQFGMNAPMRKHSSTRRARHQNEGTSLFALEDEPQHAERTVIQARFVKTTPEQFILAVLKKANILGISATAEVPTVLNHYDLDYLSEQLGVHYMIGRNILPKKTLDTFDLLPRYERHGVNIEVKRTLANQDLRQILKRWLSQAQYAQISQTALTQFQQWFKQFINDSGPVRQTNQAKNSDYISKRYMKLFESFVVFLAKPELITFLGLENILAAEGKPEMDAGFIGEAFEAFKRLLDVKDAYLAVIRPGVTQPPEQVKQAYSRLEVGQRVYLLSAYQTLGVGQNLQHKLTALDAPFVVNIVGDEADASDARQLTADLSGMYLGKVTHVVGQTTPLKLNEVGINSVIQLQRLLDAGEIDQRQSRMAMRLLTTGQPLRDFKQVASVVGSHTQIVAQALGRMNRTFNKCKSPVILINDEECQCIHPSGLPLPQYSAEMQMLFMSIKSVNSPSYQTIAQNRRDIAVADCQSRMKYLFAHHANEETIAEYDEIRFGYLRHPTASTAQLQTAHIDKTHSYWEFAELLDRYSVFRIADGKYDYQPDLDQPMKISASAAKLDVILKYPGMRNYFIEHGFALTWELGTNLLNPYQFNLYCGILGEMAGRYILESTFHQILRPLDAVYRGGAHELFDYAWGEQVVIDFKHWAAAPVGNETQRRHWVREKLDTLDALASHPLKVLLVNITGSSPAVLQRKDGGRILELSALIDVETGQLALSEAQVMELWRWVNE